MQYAFFTHLPWPEGADPKQIVEQATQQIQYAEELGFKSAWLAEHHFHPLQHGIVFADFGNSPGRPHHENSAWAPRSWCRLCTTPLGWPKTPLP